MNGSLQQRDTSDGTPPSKSFMRDHSQEEEAGHRGDPVMQQEDLTAAEHMRGDQHLAADHSQEEHAHQQHYSRDSQPHEIQYPEAVHAHHYSSHMGQAEPQHYGQSAVYGGSQTQSLLTQQPNLMALMQQEGPVAGENMITDAQGRQVLSPGLDIQSLLPMLLQQNLAQSIPSSHLPTSLQLATANQQSAPPRSEAEYRSASAFHSSGPSFQGTGAFAPLRPQATPATESTFGGHEGDPKPDQRIASSQGPTYAVPHPQRGYGWSEQGASPTEHVTPGSYAQQGQYEHQVGLGEGQAQHHQHHNYGQLVENATAAAQHSQRDRQADGGTLVRPQPHKPPQATKSSRFRGVYKRQRGGRWESSIVLDSKNCRLGLHLTEVAAAKAYDRVAIKKWGHQEAADKINFPLEHYNLQELDAVSMDELVAFVRSEWRSRETRPIPVGTYTPLEDPGRLPNPQLPLSVPEEEPHMAKRQRLEPIDNLGIRQSFPTDNTETHERVPVPRSSLYRGVSTHKQSGKWVAQIKSGGKQVYLGFYQDQEDAARAYDQAVIHMQGEQAETNFPLEIYAERFDQLRSMDFKDLVAALKQHGRGGVPRVPKLQTEKSIYRGVAPDKSKKWRAQITTSAKTTVYLGLWASEEGAARAYDRANIAKRGESAKTNFPVSDYSHEMDGLQAQPFDNLVTALRAEAVASVATDRANKRTTTSGNLLAPIPAMPNSQVSPEQGVERARQYLDQASVSGDGHQRYPNHMDAFQTFVSQQQMQQMNMGQSGGFSQNLSAVRNYLMANPSTRPDLLYRAMTQQDSDNREGISPAEQWRSGMQ